MSNETVQITPLTNDEIETKLFNSLMDVTAYIRLNICQNDEEWGMIQRLMRLDSGISVFYELAERDIPFDMDAYVYDFDLDPIDE